MALRKRTACRKRFGGSRALVIWQRDSVFVWVGLSAVALILPKAAKPGQPWRSWGDARAVADRGASGHDPPVIAVNPWTWLRFAGLGGVVKVKSHIVIMHRRPARHKPQQRRLHTDLIKRVEQSRTAVTARNAVLQLHETAQERLLHPTEPRHVRAALVAAHRRKKADDQHLIKRVASRVAAPAVGNSPRLSTKSPPPRTSSQTLAA